MPTPRFAWAAASLKLSQAANSQHRRRAQHQLRLLRALLRECSYLPDAQARAYMKEHLLARWRAYAPVRDAAPEYTRPLAAPPTLRFAHLDRIARKAWGQLRKANDGHLRALLKVLYMTYGRSGKRRYELLRPLTKPDAVPGDPTQKQDFITRSLEPLDTLPTATIDKLPKVSSALQALLQSQRRAALETPSGTLLKRLTLDIPAQNAWLRPTPQKRVVNLVKQFYGATLAKALPPLPEDEWKRLRRLACAEEAWGGLAPRRPMGTSSTSKTPHALAGLSPELQNELGVRYTPTLVSPSRPHYLTPRFMRRLWMRVFAMCPMMTWDVEKRRWDVQWGGPHQRDIDPDAEAPKKQKQIPTVLLQVFEMAGLDMPAAGQNTAAGRKGRGRRRDASVT